MSPALEPTPCRKTIRGLFGTSDEDDFFGDTDALVSVGWGLMMTLVASISLALAAAFNFVRRAMPDVTSQRESAAP